MSNRKYSDNIWKEKLWGRIVEEFKQSGKFQCSFVRISVEYYGLT
jgi:hypothetical protein